VVETMFSLEQMLRMWGEGDHADRLERLAYNLLPATLTAEMTAHQYHQQANQVLATIAQREWTQAGDDCTIFGLEPNFGCCTANLHQGWPKLARSLWMERPNGGLAAVVHGPSRVAWPVQGREVVIEAATDYPFGETIRYVVRSDAAVAFPLQLRRPGWCGEPEVSLNGSRVDLPTEDGSFVLDRTWRDGDEVSLRLPMQVRAIPRSRQAIGIALGPLVLAYSPGEVWQRLPGSVAFGDWEVRPRRSWNMALAVDPEGIEGVARVERFGVGSVPFGLRTGPPPHGVDGVPLKVWLPGRPVPEWGLERDSAAPPPTAPLEDHALAQPIPLVPYGCARLRIAEFPTARPSARGAPALGDPPP
jgi:hypothetical protein